MSFSALLNTSNNDSSRVAPQPVLSSTTGKTMTTILLGFVPYHAPLMKVFCEAAWHQAVSGGCVLTVCTRCVCFSVGGMWIRNTLPQTSQSWGTVWTPLHVWAWKTWEITRKHLRKAQGPWTEKCYSDASSSGAVRAAPRTVLGTAASLASRILADRSLATGCHHCFAQTSCEQPALLIKCQKAITKGWEVKQALFFLRALTLFAVFLLICDHFIHNMLNRDSRNWGCSRLSL